MRRYSLLLLLALTSCSRDVLTVRTEYFNRHSLASYYVGTPDPKQNYPEVGQRIILAYRLPKCYMELSDLHFEVTMRFGNKTQLVKRVEVNKQTGIWTYEIRDQTFFDWDGIQTYKVDLFGDGQVLSEWRHQLWSEKIIFAQPEDNQEEVECEECQESTYEDAETEDKDDTYDQRNRRYDRAHRDDQRED